MHTAARSPRVTTYLNANNKCDERKDFFSELVASKGATLNTMIGVALEAQAKAIGLVAIWDTSKTMMTTDGNLRIEFTQLPVGVIYD